MSPSENLDKGGGGTEEAEAAAEVIKSLIKALAKVEVSNALKKQDNNFVPEVSAGAVTSNPTRFLPDGDFVFESDLHYGSYNGIRHG